ncbi:MAG: NfeD family protein, partial [Pseudomonadota bacterium]
GERWRARSAQPLAPGDRIKVTEVDGLVLVVRKLKSETGGGLLPRSRPAEA